MSDQNTLSVDDDTKSGSHVVIKTEQLDLECLRQLEAIIFASAEPVTQRALRDRLPQVKNIEQLLFDLKKLYANRGVNLVQVGDGWAFRTAADLAYLMTQEVQQLRKLSRAALEVLAIIGYHQPVTRAEIEEIRGVETSKGTLDVLMETGWIKLRGRRRTPGRPVTYGTTEAFLDHFGMEEIRDLPGLDELRGSGLLSGRIPPGFMVPSPTVLPDELSMDEDPLDDISLEDLGLLSPLDRDEES